MVNVLLLFGWICFSALWALCIVVLNRMNYWMPPIYIGAAIVYYVVTYCYMLV